MSVFNIMIAELDE